MSVETRIARLEAQIGLGCDRWMVRKVSDDEYRVSPMNQAGDARTMTRAEVEALPGVRVVLPMKALSLEDWRKQISPEAAL